LITKEDIAQLQANMQLKRGILKDAIEFNVDLISPELQDIITKMTIKEADKRYSAKQCLEHDFITKHLIRPKVLQRRLSFVDPFESISSNDIGNSIAIEKRQISSDDHHLKKEVLNQFIKYEHTNMLQKSIWMFMTITMLDDC